MPLLMHMEKSVNPMSCWQAQCVGAASGPIQGQWWSAWAKEASPPAHWQTLPRKSLENHCCNCHILGGGRGGWYAVVRIVLCLRKQRLTSDLNYLTALKAYPVIINAWLYLFTATYMYIYFNMSTGLRHWFIHWGLFLLIILMNNYAIKMY